MDSAIPYESSTRLSQADDTYETSPVHPLKNEGVFNYGEMIVRSGQLQVQRDTVRWSFYIPENRVYDGYAVYVPGYFGIHHSSNAPQKELAQRGVATLTYSPARVGSSWWETATDPQALHAQTIHDIGEHLLEQCIHKEAPDATNLNLEKMMLVAHSMGGLAATRFATLQPGSVDIIYKLAACGYGHPTLPELAIDIPRGMVGFIRDELIPALSSGNIEPTIHNALDALNYLRHVRALFEARSCLLEDSRPAIQAAREAGITVAYQAYERDMLVRPDISVADHVDHHEIVPEFGHLSPISRAGHIAEKITQFIMQH